MLLFLLVDKTSPQSVLNCKMVWTSRSLASFLTRCLPLLVSYFKFKAWTKCYTLYKRWRNSVNISSHCIQSYRRSCAIMSRVSLLCMSSRRWLFNNKQVAKTFLKNFKAFADKKNSYLDICRSLLHVPRILYWWNSSFYPENASLLRKFSYIHLLLNDCFFSNILLICGKKFFIRIFMRACMMVFGEDRSLRPMREQQDSSLGNCYTQ